MELVKAVQVDHALVKRIEEIGPYAAAGAITEIQELLKDAKAERDALIYALREAAQLLLLHKPDGALRVILAAINHTKEAK